MSVLPICITGEPVLHRIADPVERFDSSLTDLVADMIDTMHEAPGVGLAAPQVGVGLQLFVWSYRGGGPFDRRYRDALALDLAPTLGFNDAMSGVVSTPRLTSSGTRPVRARSSPPSQTSPTRPRAACRSPA